MICRVFFGVVIGVSAFVPSLWAAESATDRPATDCAAASSAHYDFDKAWKEIEASNYRNLPRSVTNKLAEISREALAAKRWPHYALAFIARGWATMEWTPNEELARWLSSYAASVDAQPAPVQAVLQLHLALQRAEVSNRLKDDGDPATAFDAAAASDLSPSRIEDAVDSGFAKVLTHEAELKAEKADDWEVLISKGTVPDSCCPTLFDFAVREMLAFYEMRLYLGRSDGRIENLPIAFKKGLALCDRLAEFHRADGNLDALVMAELKRAKFIREYGDRPSDEKDAAFAHSLDGIIARYEGKTSAVAAVAAEKAGYLEDKKGDRVAARAIAAEYAKKWPGAWGGKVCAGTVAAIEQKSLDIDAECNWCAPWQEIEADVRNVREIHFRLVPVTFEELIEDAYRNGRRNFLSSTRAMREKYEKRAAVKTWKESLPLKPDYSRQTFRLPTPADVAPGHYVLYAATNDKFGADKQPCCAAYVTVTSLALVLQTGGGMFGGAVYNAVTGYPVEGATVELWGYGAKAGSKMQMREKYVTDRDGRFNADVSKGEDGQLNRHVRVLKDGEEVVSREGVGSGTRVGDVKQSCSHFELLTDRRIYRPGQEIKVKGIAYHADPETRDFHTLSNASVVLSLVAMPDGGEIAVKRLDTGKWGSFAHAFIAPGTDGSQSYVVKARLASDDDGDGESGWSIDVCDYKRRKFSVKIEKPSGKVAQGSPVTLKGCAMTYAGLPVQNAKVAWNVDRTTYYPEWWSRFGGGDRYENDFDVAKGETVTDDNGLFTITFTPAVAPNVDSAGDPSFEFEVNADVTDGTGEEHSAREAFEIGSAAWRAAVWPSRECNSSAEPVQVKVSLADLAGEALPVNGTLKAYRLKAPPRPVRERLRRYETDTDRDSKWTTWEPGEEAVSIDIKSSAPTEWNGDLNLGAGAYRLVFETTDPGGKTVKDIDTVLVFDPAAAGLGIALPSYFAVESEEVKVGETLRAIWGTGYENGYCRVKVTNNGKVLLDKAVAGDNPKWLYELPVQDEHRGVIRIETLFVKENSIYCNERSVIVPWDNKRLKVATEHLTSRLTPGKTETWKFKVSGPAEVLAFMYDESLDDLAWYMPWLGFVRHFTPRMAPYMQPTLQNSLGNLYGLDRHDDPFHANDVVVDRWPTWRYLPFMCTPFVDRLEAAGDFGSTGGNSKAAGSVTFDSASVNDSKEDYPSGLERGARYGDSKSLADSGAVAPTRRRTRRDLKETAFFFPDLETDADGNVSFTFTAPDALTGWKFYLLAHDGSLKSAHFCRTGIATTKPLMCEPDAPRFVREGDEFLFAVKVTNTANVPQKGTVDIDVPPLASPPPQFFSLAPRESKTFEFRIAIPEGCETLKYVAKANGETFADGEEGVLPVLSRRIRVREAVQLSARGKETKTFRLDNLLASKGSDTIRHQELVARTVSRPAWYAVLSLPYLMEYPHECCEQTFSRYFANVMGERVMDSGARVRAAFAAAKMEGGGLFDKARLRSEQTRCLDALETAMGDNLLWPWFPGGPASRDVTLYILTGFARLESSPGGAKNPGGCRFAAEACEALDHEVSREVKRRLADEGSQFRVGDSDARWLYLHSFGGVAPAEDKTLVPLMVNHLRREWADLGLESQALAAIALKRMGEEELAREIVASVKERAVVSEERGMHWVERGAFSSGVFSASASAQAAALEAFREVAGDEESVEACRVWLLKERQTRGWGGTAATANAIYALMLDGWREKPGGDALAEVSLGGEMAKPGKAETEIGICAVRYAADAVRPEMGEIAFTGAGVDGVSWGGVEWTCLDDVLRVRAHEPKELRIEKRYFKKVKGPNGPRLATIDGALKPGDEIVSKLEVWSDRVYECVHVSDERPACAEPVDVLSRYRWRGGAGYRQVTRDTATHYYIDRLPQGRFTMETSYRVRQRGTFAPGLAVVECMYAPEFTAHSAACERIRVGP